MQIVSGGQTGVDRGALDAALACGVACGGWCPAGRLAEDGRMPDRYPLREAPRPGYRERTARNVLDSDGTLLLYFGELSGGTEETLALCLQLRRPYRLVDAREVAADRAGALAAEFVAARGGDTQRGRSACERVAWRLRVRRAGRHGALPGGSGTGRSGHGTGTDGPGRPPGFVALPSAG
jgi:hypothetical protein